MDWPDFGGDRYLQKQRQMEDTHNNNNNRFVNRTSGVTTTAPTIHTKGGARTTPFAIRLPTGNAEHPRTQSVSSSPEIDFYSFSLERIKYLKNEASGNLQFVHHLLLYLRNTFFFIIFLVILMFLPLSMITVGAVYHDDCPRQPNVPVFLIVGGVLALVRNAVEMAARVMQCCGYVIEEDEEVCTPWRRALRRAPAVLLDGLLLVWFIAGCVWVYTTVGDYSSTPGGPDYCSPELYGFAFWVVTLVWTVGALLLLFATFVYPWLLCLCRARRGQEVKEVKQGP